MSDPDDVDLVPADLLSKYGFGDGDQCDEIVDSWAQSAWPAEDFGNDHGDDHPLDMYLGSKALLGQLLSRYVIPVLDLPPDVHLSYQRGLHNSYYLQHASGSFVEDTTRDAELVARISAAPAVVVPGPDVRVLCEQTYPRRPLGWLRLYAETTWLFALKEILAANAPAETACDVFCVGALVDYYAGLVEDDALGLASELLEPLASPQGNNPVSASDRLQEVLVAARSVVHGRRDLPAPLEVISTLPRGLLPAKAPSPARRVPSIRRPSSDPLTH